MIILTLAASCKKEKLAAPASSLDAESRESFVVKVHAILDKNPVPGGIIGIMQDGALSQIETFGYADLEAKTRPDEETIFRIGSISKTFATTLATLMVERGDFAFEDLVSRYITEIKRFDGFETYAQDLRIGHFCQSGPIPPGKSHGEAAHGGFT